MDYLQIYIGIIFIIKIAFLILSVYHVHLKRKEPNSKHEQNIDISKNILEFIFKILMSILLIYLFNPNYKKEIKLNYETKLLLFVFGFVSIFSADWILFAEQLKYKKANRKKKVSFM